MNSRRVPILSRKLTIRFIGIMILFSLLFAGQVPAARAQQPAAVPQIQPMVICTDDVWETTGVGDDTWQTGNSFNLTTLNSVVQAGPTGHSICPAADDDWYAFTLNDPANVTIEAYPPNPADALNYDTEMTLYNSSVTPIVPGATPYLDYNDDKGVGTFFSYLQECGPDILPAGTYYVHVNARQQFGAIPAYSIAFNVNSGCIPNTDISIAGQSQGTYWLKSGARVTPRYGNTGKNVHVLSVPKVLASERVHNINGFINEAMGVPANELTTDYWYPWYDNRGMATWILVGNPSTTNDAYVTISIGTSSFGPYQVSPGDSIAKQYNTMGGPVHVHSTSNVVSSQRVATGQGFVQETMGYPDSQLTKEYWFPWYDNLGMVSWILVGNPSTSADAHVTITIAGSEVAGSPFTIGPGGRITPQFGVMNGPVHVTSDINVFTSERVHGINGFVQETMGYPNNRLAKEYWLTWYDNLGMTSWILVGNPSPDTDAHVTITIAGSEVAGSPFTIPHGGRVTPQFPVMNGPVHITSDINVFASERVHTGQGFVQETMAYPAPSLLNEYWFPWYDDITTMEWVLVGRP